MDINSFIEEYKNTALESVKALENKFNTENLSQDAFFRHKSGIPQSGEFMLKGKPAKFHFHGTGCTVIIDGKEVSFDFGPGRHEIVFDFYHIHRFLESQGVDHTEQDIQKYL